MRRLGTLQRISQDTGLVAIDTAEPPSIGERVVDELLTEIGTIVDIIGPVDAPLAVVDPAESVELVTHLDEQLYVRDD